MLSSKSIFRDLPNDAQGIIFMSTVMYGSNNSNNLKSHVHRIRRCLLIKHFKQQKLPSSNEKIAITGDLLINWRTKKIVANVSLNISLGNYIFAYMYVYTHYSKYIFGPRFYRNKTFWRNTTVWNIYLPVEVSSMCLRPWAFFHSQILIDYQHTYLNHKCFR